MTWAHVKAFEYLKKGEPSIACNLGTGFGYSVLEVIKATEEVTGKKVPYEIADRRPGDATKLIADAKLALEKLGWDPKYKDVREIIRTAWQWKTGERMGRF